MVDRNSDKTRLALLHSAFDEINRHGFQAASLAKIINETKVTKGALYHHFPSKLAMGYAVVDEIVSESVNKVWVDPLADTDNVIDALLAQIDSAIHSHDAKSICFGCPINNLAQEMSPIDEGFRERINSIFDHWRQTIAKNLKEGQTKGTVKKNICPESSAYFIVAAIEGAFSLAKTSKSVDVLKTSLQGLKEHIQTLSN